LTLVAGTTLPTRVSHTDTRMPFKVPYRCWTRRKT